MNSHKQKNWDWQSIIKTYDRNKLSGQAKRLFSKKQIKNLIIVIYTGIDRN